MDEDKTIDTGNDTIDYLIKQIKYIVSDSIKIKDSREEAIKMYQGEHTGQNTEGRSKIVMPTIYDTIEWILPSVIKIFTAGDEITTIQPRGTEDIRAAQLQEELVNYQLKIKNKWFMVIEDVLRDGLLLKTGVIKYQWHNEKKQIKKTYQDIDDAEYEAMIQKAATMDNREIKIIKDEKTVINAAVISNDPSNPMSIMSPEIATHKYDIEEITTIDDEYPLIESIPSEDIGFPITTKDIESCTFLYHRSSMYAWEIQSKYGDDTEEIDENGEKKKKNIVKELKEMKDTKSFDSSSHDPAESLDIKKKRYKDLNDGSLLYDEKQDKYWVYECYYKDKKDGTSKVSVFVGDILLRDEENIYGRPPFEIFTPLRIQHRIMGMSFADILKQTQRLMTVLVRQLLDNIYFNNNGRYLIDPTRVNADDFLNNNIPGGIIRLTQPGNVNDAVQALAPAAFEPWVFELLTYVKRNAEYHSGLTEAFQGVDVNALNKTFRGQAAQIAQASQRIEMLARLFAEMTIAPLVNDVIELNIRFMKRSIALRILNQWQNLEPDDIVGKFDVVVNVGIGTGNKDLIVAQMQQLLGLAQQLHPLGLVSNENIYNMMRELIKNMGFRNVDDFITDPKTSQIIVQFIQMAMQMAQKYPQVAQTDPPFMQTLGMAMQALGIKPPNPGTVKGQATPVQPEQPMQARVQETAGDGVGHV